MFPSQLAGRHVRLDLATASDAPEVFEALDDDAVWTHVAGRPATIDEMVASLLETPGRTAYVVRTIDGGRVVGTTSYLDVVPSDARLEIGYTLYRKDSWASAVNPECKLLLMEWAFANGFGRVQLKTDIRNERSRNAILRLGAVQEGILRRYQRRADGSMRDTVMFSVLADEWPQVRANLLERLAATH